MIKLVTFVVIFLLACQSYANDDMRYALIDGLMRFERALKGGAQ